MYSGSLSLVKFLELFWESNVLFSMDEGKIRMVGISPQNLSLTSVTRGSCVIHISWLLVFTENVYHGNIVKLIVNLVENKLLLPFSLTFGGGEDSLLQSHSETGC